MTLSKLSLRNAKRQAGDYLIYFATIVMAAALLYAFNGLIYSDEVMELSNRMSTLSITIVFASVVGICIFGWLVSYATNFMLTRRSRELGTYILIGLENKQVARLFFLENLAVGAVAFVLGLLLGGLFYQILRAIVLALFEQGYRFSLTFSIRAAGLTLLYFSLIYLLALRKSQKRIRKMKIYDLIYFERQNEGKVIKSGRGRRRLFTVSIVLGIIGTLLLMTGSMLGIIGAGCVIAFLYGFFISFASGVPAFFDKHPVKKYSGQTLLVFRSLTAKLATMGALMATIALLFTATIMTTGSGLMFHGLFKGRAEENACFDLYIGMEGTERDPTPYLDYINAHIPVKQSVLYKVYEGDTSQMGDFLKGEYYHFGYHADPVIRYSDYAALRSVAGYDSVVLEPGQYLIHCRPDIADTLKKYSQSVDISAGGKKVVPGAVYTEHLSQAYGLVNGRGFILVVPDETAENLRVHHHAYAAQTVEPVSETDMNALYDIEYQLYQTAAHDDYVTTRAGEIREMAFSTAIIIFPLYFLALALSMTAATILTIQQLSESNRYHRQFELLRKLGMERQEMIKALRMQSIIYYAMPAIPPILIGVPFILNLANQPEPGVMVGFSSPAAIVMISLSLFFLIYIIYICLACTSLKKNVLPDI